MTELRTFTADAAPPVGESIVMHTEAGQLLHWNGKRWAWEEYVFPGSQMYEAWPPDVDGPFLEVSL